MLMDKTSRFFISEWKRILTLFSIALVWNIITFLFIYTLDPDLTANAYERFGGTWITIFRSVVEFTITYYVLIFLAWLPGLQDNRWGRFVAVVAILFAVKFGYSMLYEYAKTVYEVNGRSDKVTKFMTANKMFVFSLTQIFTYLFNLAITFVVAVFMHFSRREKLQKELEKQKMDAELSAIKYQINPHFLFNSLSFIYSKTVPLSEEVSNAVLLLSDIMRYALGKEEDAEGKVALTKEITHMKNVIGINQMRFNNKLSIQYSEQLENPGARIAPLILITLVENAFKHGDLLDPANPLVVRTEADDQRIRFYIGNKKKQGPKELSTSIGLNNVRQRLQLTYQGNYSFTINETEHFYTAELIIQLHKK
ncbi:sensor histidine kinase [Chitinophaga caseinilytica]|uniref:Histidine kinase n=1 Tax=Chitinophaga caseinilytica TaxID=2267521 RepID=A0ABZ2YYM3_9BACT